MHTAQYDAKSRDEHCIEYYSFCVNFCGQIFKMLWGIAHPCLPIFRKQSYFDR